MADWNRSTVVNDSGVYLPVRILSWKEWDASGASRFIANSLCSHRRSRKKRYGLNVISREPLRTREAAWAARSSTFPYRASRLIHIDGLLYVPRPSTYGGMATICFPHFPSDMDVSIWWSPALANRSAQDISARSPIVAHDPAPRQSLDSARFPRLPRSAVSERRFEHEPPTAEEGFEDVGLNDDQKQPPKKRGFFAKFGSEPHPHAETTPASTPTVPRFLMPGRKRGHSGSGQGSELGQMERPQTAASMEQEVQA